MYAEDVVRKNAGRVFVTMCYNRAVMDSFRCPVSTSSRDGVVNADIGVGRPRVRRSSRTVERRFESLEGRDGLDDAADAVLEEAICVYCASLCRILQVTSSTTRV